MNRDEAWRVTLRLLALVVLSASIAYVISHA